MPVFEMIDGDQLVVGDNVIFIQEIEHALVGIGEIADNDGNTTVAVYDRDECINTLEKNFRRNCENDSCADVCEHYEDALEWFSYNVLGSLRSGDIKNPIFISSLRKS
jgi:hypothetical protein